VNYRLIAFDYKIEMSNAYLNAVARCQKLNFYLDWIKGEFM